MPHSKKEFSQRHCMIVFAPYPLGETRVQREAEALLINGFFVDVICLRLPGDSSLDEYNGVKIYREKYRLPFTFLKGSRMEMKFFQYFRFFFSAGFRLTKLHFQNKYTSIQVHNMPDFLVFCVIIPKLMGVPVILDLHDLMPELFNGNFGKNTSLLARIIRWQERMACKFANHVITVSEQWRQTLINRGVPKNKCSVVMNVADERIFQPIQYKSLRSLEDDNFRLLYYGTIRERFGLDIAIRALGMVKKDIPKIHLTLIGDGDYLSYLKKIVTELNLSQNVSIRPTCLAEDLPKIICDSDLGVVPYRKDVFMDSALPTKLMEFAAMGFPAIASRTKANESYFSGANVEFFEPGNVDDLASCILYLYRNQDRLYELAIKSENFNKRFNWAQISKEYISLVNRLSGANPDSGTPKF